MKDDARKEYWREYQRNRRAEDSKTKKQVKTSISLEHHARLFQIKEDQAHRTLADTIEYLIDQK